MFDIFTFTIFGSPVGRASWNWDAHTDFVEVIETQFHIRLVFPLYSQAASLYFTLSPSTLLFQSLCVFSAFVFVNKLCKQLNLSISTKNSRKLRAKHFIVTILSFMITGLVFWPIGCLFLFKLLSNKKKEEQRKKETVGRVTELYDGNVPCCVLSGF